MPWILCPGRQEKPNVWKKSGCSDLTPLHNVGQLRALRKQMWKGWGTLMLRNYRSWVSAFSSIPPLPVLSKIISHKAACSAALLRKLCGLDKHYHSIYLLRLWFTEMITDAESIYGDYLTSRIPFLWLQFFTLLRMPKDQNIDFTKVSYISTACPETTIFYQLKPGPDLLFEGFRQLNFDTFAFFSDTRTWTTQKRTIYIDI